MLYGITLLSTFTVHLCIRQTILCKATFTAFRVDVFFLSVSVFPGNQTHDFGFIGPCSIV